MVTTFTLTGTLKHPDGITPIVGSGLHAKAAPYPDASLKVLLTAGLKAATDANGAFSMTLESRTGLYYTIKSLANTPLFTPIQFLAPTAGTTVDITALTTYNPTGVPASETTIASYLAAAQAAVASVAISTWQASTAYVAGQVVQAPDGSRIKRNTSGTSRASFDATEQGLWTVVFAVAGTLEKSAFGTVTQAYFDAPSGGDDKAAILAGLASPGANGGNLPLRPGATYLTSDTVIVPNKVRLSGGSRSSTTIKAHSSFPTTGKAIVQLGPSGLAFASRVENLSIDCNNVALSKGIYSQYAQEMCGASYVNVSNFRDIGIHMDTACADYGFEFVEVYGSTSGANKGVFCDTNVGSNSWRNITIGGQTAQLTTAMHLSNGTYNVQDIHIENSADGVYFAGSQGVALDVTGPTVTANVTNLVRMSGSSRYVFVAGIIKNAASVTVKDDFFGASITDGYVQAATLGNHYIARLNHYGDQLGFYGKAPVSRGAALTAPAAAAPAGGTGTAAGGWSNATDRDTAIALLNNLRTRLLDVEARLNTSAGVGMISG